MVHSLIRSNARNSFSSCPTDLQKLQNKFLEFLWYFCTNGQVIKWWPTILHISQYTLGLGAKGFESPIAIYYIKVGHSFLWRHYVMHVVHHTSSHFYFSLESSCNWIVNATNYEWTWAILMPFSPRGDSSNFMVISSDSNHDVIFYCVKGNHIWGINPTMNHSLWCSFWIWKANRSFNILKLWSKSHTDSFCNFLISFNFVVHCDSNFGF